MNILIGNQRWLASHKNGSKTHSIQIQAILLVASKLASRVVVVVGVTTKGYLSAFSQRRPLIS